MVDRNGSHGLQRSRSDQHHPPVTRLGLVTGHTGHGSLHVLGETIKDQKHAAFRPHRSLQSHAFSMLIRFEQNEQSEHSMPPSCAVARSTEYFGSFWNLLTTSCSSHCWRKKQNANPHNSIYLQLGSL